MLNEVCKTAPAEEEIATTKTPTTTTTATTATTTFEKVNWSTVKYIP